MRIPRAALPAALLACAVLGPSPLRAAPPMDIAGYVLLWASGRYTAPAICKLPDGPRRVARNISILPPKKVRPRAKHRLTIEPIGMGELRCISDLGETELEIEGSATLSYTGSKRTDTARRDFGVELRREGGFGLNLETGHLKVGVGDAQRRVDLKGGTLFIRPVDPTSDAARMLGDVGGFAARTLELTSADGTRFVFNAAHLVPRPPSR